MLEDTNVWRPVIFLLDISGSINAECHVTQHVIEYKSNLKLQFTYRYLLYLALHVLVKSLVNLLKRKSSVEINKIGGHLKFSTVGSCELGTQVIAGRSEDLRVRAV